MSAAPGDDHAGVRADAQGGALVLALDQGGHASRALVFDRGGKAVARGSCEVGETRSGADCVEQDPEELVRSLRRAAKDAIKHLGKRERDLASAGLATQRSSVVAWDAESGAALSPVLSWQDRRAADRIEELREHAETVRAATGLRLSPHYGASKMAWILANVPAAAAALREGRLVLGPLASFLAFRLLDERPRIADPANASRTLLWNVGTQRFDPGLCDMFGVPIGTLPRCVPTRAGAPEGGHGTFDARNRKIPLTVLTGDQSAALFAAGEPDPAVASVNFGTGAFVQRTFSDATIDAPRLLKSVVFADERGVMFALEGTVNGAGSAVQSAILDLGLGDVEPDLEGWLARETDPPLFQNGVSGLGAPYWVPDFASRFTAEGTREAKMVAVLESVVFLVRVILDEMSAALPPPRTIRVSGGLSQIDGLCQRLASLAGVPVERAGDPEATARGLAWLVHASPQFAAQPSTRFEPRPDARLQERCARFREAIERELPKRAVGG